MNISFVRGDGPRDHALTLSLTEQEAGWLLAVAKAIVAQMEPPPEILGMPVVLDPKVPPGELRIRSPLLDKRKIAQSLGYEGDPCNDCGMLMLRRKGTCLTCDGCGRQTGCS